MKRGVGSFLYNYYQIFIIFHFVSLFVLDFALAIDVVVVGDVVSDVKCRFQRS